MLCSGEIAAMTSWKIFCDWSEMVSTLVIDQWSKKVYLIFCCWDNFKTPAYICSLDVLWSQFIVRLWSIKGWYLFTFIWIRETKHQSPIIMCFNGWCSINTRTIWQPEKANARTEEKDGWAPTLVTGSQWTFFVPLLTMPVGGMAWGWSKQGLHAMPLSLLLPIHHSPQLVNSPQIHYQPSASFSKIFFHLSMIYCPLPPSYSLEIPSSALSSSSPVSCLWPFQPSAGSPRAAVSIVRLNSSRASSLRRPQCAASVLPRGPRPRPPPSRQWPPPLPGLPFIPPIGPLSRLPANPVVRWRGAALCAQDRGAGTSRPPAGQRPIVRRCTHGGALGSRSFLWGKLHEDQCSPGPRVRGTIVWATWPNPTQNQSL